MHVTLNPPGDSPAKIKRYKTGFILCGLVAVGLIGIQTYRNVEAQNALKGQLARIEANTKTPPKVEVTNNVPPSQVVVNNTIQTPQRAWITTAVQISPVGGWRGDEEKAEAPGRLDWGSWKNQFSRRRLSL